MRLVLLVLGVLSLSCAAPVCVPRKSDLIKCTLDVSMTQAGMQPGAAFFFVFAKTQCVFKAGYKLKNNFVAEPSTCYQTDALGCCCFGKDGDERQRFDICERAPSPLPSGKDINTNAIDFNPMVIVPSPKPHDISVLKVDEPKLKIPFDPKAPTWMWSKENFTPIPPPLLQFNKIMEVYPKTNVPEVNTYKLVYLANHFSGLPFAPVLFAAARLQAHLEKRGRRTFHELMHNVICNLYQGIKTYRFLDEGFELDPSFKTSTGDHVFADSLIGPHSDLQVLTAIFYNPYQVVGHFDPNGNIRLGKKVWNDIGYKASAPDVADDLARDLILISNIDVSAWARLYQRSMRKRGTTMLPDTTVRNIGLIILNDIEANWDSYVAYMSH